MLWQASGGTMLKQNVACELKHEDLISVVGGQQTFPAHTVRLRNKIEKHDLESRYI